MEKISILEAITILENMKEIKEEKIIDLVNSLEIFQEQHLESFVEYMRIDKAYDQAVINLVKDVFPKAHYGFNYNPAIQPDKNGREKCAQGWVRVSSAEKKFNPIDWSISHKYTSIAFLIALLHVLHDYNKLIHD